MSEGQSQRSVASSVQHRQEAEVAAAEECERAVAETAATAARAARLEALRASSTGRSVSVDDDRDNELKLAREAAREQAAQWAAAHPQGRRCGSPDGRGRVDGGGWVDGDRDLYRHRGSPSPDRYHGHHGIQAIVRDVGPDGGWPTLTKTNYVEWAVVMRVRL
jgi:hypothetical protein